MSRPHPIRTVRQWLCPHIHTHERSWDDGHPDQCKYCRKAMPLDPTRSYVGLTNPSSGD